MDQTYSFLKDELAIIEIRKHKWIESQKLGYEIGFATAAVDWVKKYGMKWRKAQLEQKLPSDLFSEKRKFRRFEYNLPMSIMVNEAKIKCHTKDFSLVGVSCTIEEYVPENIYAHASIEFNTPNFLMRKPRLQFESKILRTAKKDQKSENKGYEIFLTFNEETRDFLRANLDSLAATRN